jgi:hypothetical protein
MRWQFAIDVWVMGYEIKLNIICGLMPDIKLFDLIPSCPDMSRKSAVIRSSLPSARYFPYSRSYDPASPRRLPSPPASGKEAGNDPPEISLSLYNHPSTLHLNHPSPSPQSMHAAQSSSSDHDLESSRYQDCSFTQQPADFAQIPLPQGSYHLLNPTNVLYPGHPTPPVHLGQPPFPQRLYPPHPDTNISYLDPAISRPAHLLSNSQPLLAALPSVTARQPEDSTYQNCSVAQQALQTPQGQVLTCPVRSVFGLLSRS